MSSNGTKTGDVTVKVSTCNKCKCTVRVSVLHMMTDADKVDFALEVFNNNLSVSQMPVGEFKQAAAIFCECKTETN